MGDPVFQTVQNAAFDQILALYGQDCQWITGGITDNVLFNDPTQNQRFSVISGRGLNHVGYDNADIVQPYMEFRRGQFPGLVDLVYDSGPNQYVVIGGITFVCVKMTAFFDGQTYRVGLNEAIDEPIIPGL